MRCKLSISRIAFEPSQSYRLVGLRFILRSGRLSSASFKGFGRLVVWSKVDHSTLPRSRCRDDTVPKPISSRGCVPCTKRQVLWDSSCVRQPFARSAATIEWLRCRQVARTDCRNQNGQWDRRMHIPIFPSHLVFLLQIDLEYNCSTSVFGGSLLPRESPKSPTTCSPAAS